MGILVLKIIRTLFVTFTQPTGHPEIENEGDLVNYLEEKHDFLNLVIENFKNYMERMIKVYFSSAKYTSATDT